MIRTHDLRFNVEILIKREQVINKCNNGYMFSVCQKIAIFWDFLITWLDYFKNFDQ